MGVHKKASNVGVYGETGKLPLCFDGAKLSCDYFYRCKNSPNNSLVKKAFLEQKRLDLGWYHNMTELLAKNRNGPHKIESINVFQNLRTRFITNWSEFFNKSPKVEFYSTVKTSFKSEEYLDNPIYKYRTALSRLRISAHNLEIEIGRYVKKNSNCKPPVSRAERFCRYCHEVLQIQVVESEEHVLNDCLLYVKHRLKFMSFSNSLNTLTVTEICRQIFTDADSDLDENSKANIRFQLSKFCHNIFDHRKAFLDFLDDYIE